MIGGLAEYKYLFTTELIFAVFLFSFKLNLRDRPYFRIPVSIAVIYLITSLFPIGEFSYNFWYTSILFFTIFAATIVSCLFIFDEDFNGVVFVALAGYATQHLAYECYNLALNLFNIGSFNSLVGYGQSNDSQALFNPISILVYLFAYLDIYWLCYFLFGYRIQKHAKIKVKYPSVLIGLVAVMAVDIVINAVVTFYSYTDFNRFYMIFNEVYNMICSLGILLIMFNFLQESELKAEPDEYQNLLYKQTQQYEMSKANIDLLNIKCHDLKHQIRALAQGGKSLDTNELKQISEVISVYDAGLKTGCEALNIVLMEKQMVCKQQKINLSVIADGASLSFIRDNEIYSLFGNAIDNAIEASMKVPEEKSFISIVIERKKGFVSIVIRNYYDGIVKTKAKKLITTKKDQENHGFGTKSIQFIVQNYNGDIQMIPGENNIFTLNILLPIPA